MKRTYSTLIIGTFLLLLTFAAPRAFAFKHPSIPTTLEELDTIKANLNREPWKRGYEMLAADGRSQLTYTMQGPFVDVSRAGSYDQYLGAWRNDMIAVYNLARMWYFTGNAAYAQKSRDILVAWATTNTNFSGNEAGLDLGDYANAWGGGASILRGTWPGWTAADTVAVQNYFSNVLWMPSAGWPTQGPANKGAIYLEAGIAIAVFCDNEPSKFEHVLNMFRTFHGTGLGDTLPTGQLGETGRDRGHSYGQLLGMAFVAEVAWKQGVDLYSELDNRLLACGEYYARNSFTTDNPYVYFGSIDWQWINNVPGPYTASRAAFYLLQNAYKNRKGLPTPWMDRQLEEPSVDATSFMYAKTADFTTATVTPASFPTVSPASSGLTLTTLGSQTAGRSASYSNGVWTMTGLGSGTWSDTTDDCQFAYQTMTGDCAMVAKVTSLPYTGSNEGRAGLMIRDNLTANVSQRAWIGIVPAATMLMQAHMRGWTVNWAGAGYDDRSHIWPPGIPYWVKIERRGKYLSTFASPDGASWSPLTCTYYGNLPSTLYIGLFLSSGNTTTNTVTFENVAFTGGTGGLVTTPAAPIGVLASGSNKAITLRWLASYGATAYDVLRSTTSGSGYTVIASDLTPDKTSYVDTTAVAGATYYYVVQAKNAVGTSGNSPEFGAALLSAPMVNLGFSGTATASSYASSSEVPDKAFDTNAGSKWFNAAAPTGWIQKDFGAGNAQVIKRYTISSADVATRDPKDWQLQGSQDGVNWTTLDTQSGQLFAYRQQQKTYNIGNTTAYQYYRLDITANNGATNLAVAELGLWGDSGRTLPDGTYAIVSRNSNKVLDLAAGDVDVVQAGWNGADRQRWQIAWQGDGQYRATNLASAKALDNGGTPNAGATLIVQPSSGSSSQLWTVAADSDGFYRITSANSGLVVDVSGGSTADGANIIQGSYSGSDSQLWRTGILSTPQPIPPTPTGLTATPTSISQINLSWTASPGAINYRVKRATSSGGPYTTLPGEANTTTWSDTGLTTSTTYYYVVAAVNGSGESADSAPANATTLAAPPAAPTGLTVSSGANRVALVWTATAGATSYTVSRAPSSGGPYTTVAEGLTSTTYTDTSVANDVAYYYVVSAVNAHGSSPDSAEVTIAAGTFLAHLKFDESDGATIAPDSSGRGQHATLVNSAGFAAGMLDNALDLPASASQHAKLPSGILNGVTDFTVSTWVKVNTIANWQRIFDFGTGSNNYMFLTTQYGGSAAKLRFAIRTPSVAEQNVSVPSNGPALTAGVWTHVAVTRSGTAVSLYINGALAGSGNIPLSPSDLGATTLNYLGKSQFNDPHLNGRLDDFRLYAYALSADELGALAHPPAGAPTRLTAVPGHNQATLSWAANGTSTHTVKRSATSGGPYVTLATGLTNTTYTDTGLTDGATYYYVVSGANAEGSGPDSAEISVIPNPLSFHLKFDESGGTIAADSSGGARDAALVNAPGFAAGAFGNALNLTATSSQYAKLPSGIVSGLTDFTISTWIKVNTFVTWQRIFDFGSGTNNYMFLTAQGPAGAGRPRFAIRTPSVAEQRFDSSIALTAGAWTHVAVTRSGTTVSLYINGALAGSGTITLSPSDLGVTTLNYLGKGQFNDPYLNSALDDFRLHNVALSASEIAFQATPLAAPQDLAVTPGPLSLDLTWSAVPNATHYTVKYATTSGGPYVTLASGLTATSQHHAGLNYGAPYYYVVSASNSLYDGPASAEIAGTVAQAPASVTLGDLAFTYDGTPKATTVTTDPAGLAVEITYDGNDTAPTNAGSYSVTATVTENNYVGSATGTLTIEKAPASVTLGTLAFTYDGTPKSTTATTTPADLMVSLTYNGSTAAPINAGAYAVAATVTNTNYAGSTSGTLTIAKAPAAVALAPLAQRYDGTPKSVTSTTTPADLAVVLTYDGVSAAPIYPGEHTVVATIDDANYTGSKTETLEITTTALVRHAPTFNADVDGSVQVLLPESITLNGSAAISGDLLVPGAPTVQINGSPTYVGAVNGPGSTTPTNHTITLNSGAVLRYVVKRIDAIAMPTVSAPPLPAGTRDVALNNTTQAIGDLATLRNLTLNSGAGTRTLAAGTYGSVMLNSGTLVLGSAGATEPEVYNLQGLTLNSGSQLQIAGPVILTLANATTFNSSADTAGHPEWFTVRIASGGLTLNSGASLEGHVIAPSGTVTINSATLRGTVTADRLTLNGSGLLDETAP